MVKHGGPVLAVEGTYILIGDSIGCTHGMVIKRRNGAGEETATARAIRLNWRRGRGGRAICAWAISKVLVVKR